MAVDVLAYLSDKQKIFDEALKNWLSRQGLIPSKKLDEALRYSLFARGKRVRPALVFASAEALGLTDDDVMPIAISVEMIHVFSLIHDDLPCMDDDDLRRGQPSNHKVFGEAMALLAGDALLADAFASLTELDASRYAPQSILQVIREVSTAAGSLGMISGQAIDILAAGSHVVMSELRLMHSLKTGALIRACVLTPAILLDSPKELQKSLADSADAMGLAFQIADDILDIEGKNLGKKTGADEAKQKSTYPKILGLDAAKNERSIQENNALQALSSLDHRADALRALIRFIVQRDW